ncbi:MAG: enoyl-[acyl-carrier-protein] reductase FabK [Oscillospiraceae bacterium]|nr:enoyl-[acyl-carrier-protein] reductase FabK [Oscillospiraceae bacterium]
MKTRLNELLGIKYPVIQGGMAWVAEAELASAVSNAGGAGLIAGGSADAEIIRKEIYKAKELTDKPFGINVMLMSPYAEDLMQLACEEKVALVTTGAGSPGKYIEKLKEAGIKVIPVVSSVALAKRMERAGADAVIAEGMEAGGHIGSITTMCLTPQIADAVKIPVVAAGGIGDGRTLAAAFALGAQGVQIGTLLLLSDECKINGNYKEIVIAAKDTDSVITGTNTGHPVRQIRNKFTRRMLDREKEGMSPGEYEKLTEGSLRKAAVDGNREEGSFMAGQIAGMLNENSRRTAKELIENLFDETENIINKLQNV